MVIRRTLARSQALRGVREDVRLLRSRATGRWQVAHSEHAGQAADERRERAVAARRRQVAAYLEEHPEPRLQVGSGRTVLPGWLSTDLRPRVDGVLAMDATRPFPLPTSAFDAVFTEHMIEHVSWADGQTMLAECRRVLRPGGVLRVATPDLAVLVALYRGETGADGDHYVDWVTRRYLPRVRHRHPVFVINNAVRNWGHTFLYDGDALTLALTDAGFTDVRRVRFGESDHPALRGLESHGSAVADERSVVFETMVWEATAP